MTLFFYIMRVYQVPPNMNEKEKIIGGLLTLPQFFWLLGGLGLGALVFSSFFLLTGSQGFSLVFGGLFSLSGVPFALIKRRGIPLFRYMSLKRKLKQKNTKLPKKRRGITFDNLKV